MSTRHPTRQMNSDRMLRAILMFQLPGLVLMGQVFSQTTPQPTPPFGTNSVVFNSGTNEYFFQFNSQTIYKYSINDGTSFYQTGATFNALKAVAQNGNEFWPSYVGGLGALLAGVERMSGDAGVTYQRLEASRLGDTVLTRWRMKYSSDSIDYKYRFHISGRTLVIRVEVENGSTKATVFHLDRCENAGGARVVRVPYLTLFNLLYSDDGYTSMFFDWEVTMASELWAYTPPFNYSGTSVYYSQIARYNTNTKGQRHPLKETVYLTVSGNLDEVLPNLPGPTAPFKAAAANKIVLSYGPPYPWLYGREVRSCSDYGYKYLDSLKNRGVENLAVIIKQYQRIGYDRGYPKVLPASTYTCPWSQCPSEASDRNQLLRQLRDHVVNDLGYSFALHENYMDYYQDADDQFTFLDCARESNGNYILGWNNTDCNDQSFVLKPSRAADYLRVWSENIRLAISPTWSYLDVHSAHNPSGRVDYDAGIGDSAAMFVYTLRKYRELPGILRSKYNGPVQGEGNNHFLYAGYFDDLEAGIFTGDYRLYGWKAPLLVDFDLQKMHLKSALHGVGHNYLFFSQQPGIPNYDTSYAAVLTLIATELAYGHGGLITKGLILDHTIDQAVLEYKHVLPVYQDIASANPVSIQYRNGGWQDASTYIKTYEDYDDCTSNNFMSQVRVEYSNGVVVCVNRHPNPNRTLDVSLGVSGQWFAYHAIINGKDSLGTGVMTTTSFTLPAQNGWVVYDSLRTPPPAPVLASPGDRATNISIPPTLSWNASTAATGYRLQVSSNTSFSPTVFDQSGITTTSYAVSGLANNTTYYWRVNASNAGGPGDWSSTWSFRTISLP